MVVIAFVEMWRRRNLGVNNAKRKVVVKRKVFPILV